MDLGRMIRGQADLVVVALPTEIDPADTPRFSGIVHSPLSTWITDD